MPKCTIRQGVWETNSSSMHSIAVMKNDGKYTHDEIMQDVYIWDGKWKIYNSDYMDFGRWPFRVLTTFREKMLYAIAEFAGSYGRYDDGCKFMDEVMMPIVYKYIPECKQLVLPKKWEPAYNDQDGNPLDYDDVSYRFFKCDDGTYEGAYAYQENGEWHKVAVGTKEGWKITDFGIVDHQSHGLLKRFLEKEGITLEDFLVNRQYIIIIDGDEYCDWERYKTMGIINTVGIDHEYHMREE